MQHQRARDGGSLFRRFRNRSHPIQQSPPRVHGGNGQESRAVATDDDPTRRVAAFSCSAVRGFRWNVQCRRAAAVRPVRARRTPRLLLCPAQLHKHGRRPRRTCTSVRELSPGQAATCRFLAGKVILVLGCSYRLQHVM